MAEGTSEKRMNFKLGDQFFHRWWSSSSRKPASNWYAATYEESLAGSSTLILTHDGSIDGAA
jgi:hypothetical protein